MARKPRLHVPGGLYHVMLRGNGGADIFFSKADRRYFYALLEEGGELRGQYTDLSTSAAPSPNLPPWPVSRASWRPAVPIT